MARKELRENGTLEFAVGEIFCRVQDLSEAYGAWKIGNAEAAQLMAKTAAEIVEACGLVGEALIQ